MRVWNLGEDSTEQAAPNDLRTAEEDAWDQWRSQLISEGGEHRDAEAVLPNWETWRSRHDLPFTYRMTQVLTGHGDFGEYLRKIGRETTDICYHCGEGRDTVQNTVLSGVRGVPLHPAARHRRKIDPVGDRRSDVERATGI
ncbi:uncharacterized protein LOC117213344 [Bombus bifarius]|uniref:Uncharacterized protein LOC117213344 n=1 Tax=Bombus bifarius TaxID=103933 RepID=A0A6P8N1J6_9HYME|nr:uncharacterized protein LOC117213344 [Bombus bifarius]